MSFGQQNRTTESWNNDPNSFSNMGGPDAGFQNQNQRGNWDSNQQMGSNRPTHDPTDTSTWNENSARRGFESGSAPQSGGQDQLWTAGRGDNYGTTGYGQGNTTDANTIGAGGNFGSSGRGAGVGGDNWQQDQGRNDNNWNNEPTPGAGKASLGERLMGNAEKMAGRVTGNPSMVERGQVRKSGNPDDTNWNSNDY